MGRIKGIIAVAVAAGFAMLGMPAFAGAAVTADTTPPVLVGLIAQPTTVNVTSGPATTAITMRVTDDASGFSYASLGFSCTCGGTTLTPNQYQSVQAGPDQNGWFTYTVEFPQTTPSGTYALSTLTLNDSAGHSVTYPDSTPWPAGVTPPSITVTRTADATPPAVGSISFVPSTLDVTQANKNAVVDVHLSDAIPGVDHGTITVTDGTNDQDLYFDNTNRISGTPQDGVYEVTFPVAYYAAGTYAVKSVDAFDAYGNDNMDTSPGGESLAVTATADTHAPTIGTVTVSPNAVDTTSAQKIVTVTANVRDDVSGFEFGSAELSDGANSIFGYFDPSTLTNGTVTNGTYSFPVTVPVNTAPGDYTLALRLTDFQGNSSDPLAVSGPHTDVQVTTTPDPVGPQVTAFTVSPAAVNVHGGFGQAYAHITVTDNGSAFDRGQLSFTAPDSSSTFPIDFYPTNRVSGDAQNGNYLVAVPLSQVGTYTAPSITVTSVQGISNPADEIGSIATIDQAGDTGSNSAPAPGIATIQPTSGDTTSGPVDVTVTIPVTDAAPAGVTPTGLSFGSVTLASPTGNSTALGSFSSYNLISGDDQTGVYRASVQVPQWSEKGTWTLTDVYLSDNARNSQDYQGAQLRTLTGAPTVAISGPIDIKAPTVTSITPAQSSVDTSGGPRAATFDLGAADDLSGVDSGELTLTSPKGEETFGELSRTAGTSLNGHYSANVQLPQYGQAGNWTMSLTLWDDAGNMRTYTSADLSAAGLPGTISVTTAPDSLPPRVAGLSFDPPAGVDTTNGPADALVTAHLTDNASGATSAYLTLTSPNGQSVHSDLRLVGGSTTDGFWQGGLHFNQFLNAGNWTVEFVLSDQAGNFDDLTPAVLALADLPSTYPVAGPADTTPPAVTSVGISPASVDVRSQEQTVMVTVGVSDAGSGVASGSFVLEPQSGQSQSGQSQSITGSFFNPPVTGNINSGTWQAQVKIPQFVVPGTWQLDALNVFDNSGNSHTYSTANLNGLGTTSFTVQSTPDITPPSVSAVSFNPNPVDVSSSPQQITATVTATDVAGSGIVSGFVNLVSPDGKQSFIGADSFTLSSGTAQSGTWTATIAVPRYVKAGTWSVSQLSLTDAARNSAFYGTGSAPLPIYTPLSVIDTNPDTTAPTVADIGVAPSSVDVSHGQQDVTLDFHVTDGQSGVRGVSYVVSSPSGGQQLSGDIGALFSGSPQDGHWKAVLTLGSHAEAGVWKISSVGVTDAIGNSAAANAPNVPATNQFTVSGTVVTVPGAPAFVTATPGNRSATVFWNRPADNGGSAITGYTISVGGQAVLTVGPNASSATVTGLTNGSPVTIGVAATNSAGTGPVAVSNSVTPTATVPAAPATPTAQIGDQQVTLTWAGPDNGGDAITGYDIKVTPAPTPQTGLIHVGPSSTSAVIKNLTNNTTYTFQVRAVNGIGNGAYSPSVAATPIALPAAPTISSAVPGDGSVTLKWTPVAGTDGYRVATSGSVTDLASTGTTVTVPNLTNGTAYSFTVAAHNAAGWGPASTVVKATAGGQLSGLAFAPSIPATGAPSLTVSWAPASVPPSATGVRACLQPASAATPTFSTCTGGVIQDVSASVTHALFGSLVSGRAYRATVWPDYGGADPGAPASATATGSAFSNPALATITDGAAVALSAKLLVAGTSTPLAGQTVTLWQKAAGATGWSPVTPAVFHTNASGMVLCSVLCSVKPQVTTVYQWRYAGAAAHLAAAGSETVKVAFAVAEHATALSMHLGGTTYLYGTVAPLAKNQPVYLQKGGVTQSTHVAILLQKLPNGVTTWGYKLAFKPGARGTYLIRIYKPASSQNLAGYGVTLKLVVT